VAPGLLSWTEVLVGVLEVGGQPDLLSEQKWCGLRSYIQGLLFSRMRAGGGGLKSNYLCKKWGVNRHHVSLLDGYLGYSWLPLACLR